MKYRYSLISLISLSLNFLCPWFKIVLHCSNVITTFIPFSVCLMTLIFCLIIGAEGFHLLAFCVDMHIVTLQCKDI